MTDWVSPPPQHRRVQKYMWFCVDSTHLNYLFNFSKIKSCDCDCNNSNMVLNVHLCKVNQCSLEDNLDWSEKCDLTCPVCLLFLVLITIQSDSDAAVRFGQIHKINMNYECSSMDNVQTDGCLVIWRAASLVVAGAAHVSEWKGHTQVFNTQHWGSGLLQRQHSYIDDLHTACLIINTRRIR